MKALILAAGYATRLYPLTKDKAKPLLPVGGKPIIDYILEDLEKVSELDQVYVVTNSKFTQGFKDWAEKGSFSKPIKVIDDGTSSDDDKLGAIGDIHFVIDQEKIDDELMIIAGDNIFETDLNEFVSFYRTKKGAPCIASYDIKNTELAKQYGIVLVDEAGQVTRFEEKSQDPPGTLAAVGLYLLSRDKIGLIHDYLGEKQNQDAPGFYISWLVKKGEVYAFPLKGKWYDIGDLGSYKKADEEYSARNV